MAHCEGSPWISNKGSSEKGTLYAKPLYREHYLGSQKLEILLIKNLQEEDIELFIRDKTAEFSYIVPKVALL